MHIEFRGNLFFAGTSISHDDTRALTKLNTKSIIVAPVNGTTVAEGSFAFPPLDEMAVPEYSRDDGRTVTSW